MENFLEAGCHRFVDVYVDWMYTHDQGEAVLRIRPEQMAALEAAVVRANFEDAMLPSVRSTHPELADEPDAQLRARIQRAVTRARSHGARGAEALGLFVELSISLGEGFDEAPWARATLTDASCADPDARIERLLEAGARAAGAPPGRAPEGA